MENFFRVKSHQRLDHFLEITSQNWVQLLILNSRIERKKLLKKLLISYDLVLSIWIVRFIAVEFLKVLFKINCTWRNVIIRWLLLLIATRVYLIIALCVKLIISHDYFVILGHRYILAITSWGVNWLHYPRMEEFPSYWHYVTAEELTSHIRHHMSAFVSRFSLLFILFTFTTIYQWHFWRFLSYVFYQLNYLVSIETKQHRRLVSIQGQISNSIYLKMT